jgi:hypothetical protein
MNHLTDWTVCVANIGTVCRAPNTSGGRNEARKQFRHWVKLSRDNIGRAAGEPVSLFHGERAILEYAPIKVIN